MGLRASILVTAAVLALCSPFGLSARQDAPPLDSLRRATPSGQYVDPASFFRFHGYTTVSFTQNGADVGAELGATPQILVNGPSPRTGANESGFRSDAALFVGGEPFDRVGSVLEIHFVGDALNPVLTEARFTYDLVAEDAHEIVVSGGRFWWPFGIHDGEWFSSVNDFPVVSPAAAEVVPAHYNEVGVMAEGVSRLGGAWGVNYVGAVGNGVPGFGLMPNVMATGSDADSDRTVTGRAALVRGGAFGLEVGVSGASGGLRQGEDTSLDAMDPLRYAGRFTALGLDASVEWKKLHLMGYYYTSEEELTGAPRAALERDGYTVEGALRFRVENQPRLRGVSLHVRAGRADEETLGADRYGRLQLGAGLSLHLTNAFEAQFAYVVQRERLDLPTYANNIFSLGLTAEF